MSRKRFNNLDDVQNMKTWEHFVRWQRSRRANLKDYTFVVPNARKIDTKYLHSNRTDMTVTWIGHSTFLIQIGGLNIVTDPVWANRMGVHNRMTPPGIGLRMMPEIDVVLISHSHYDHLHYRSIRRLKGAPLYLVPEGLKTKFMDKGFFRVNEFDWWDSKSVQKVKFTFVPAQHWSKRTPWDTNTSHWGGWVIQHLVQNRETVYFVGDSGYFPGFKEIGRRFTIDYALMPIGAYEPEWFMAMQHVSPEESVQAFLDVQGTHFIPMHYSTFRLADDTPSEALARLKSAWETHGLAKERLHVLDLGEVFIPSK